MFTRYLCSCIQVGISSSCLYHTYMHNYIRSYTHTQTYILHTKTLTHTCMYSYTHIYIMYIFVHIHWGILMWPWCACIRGRLAHNDSAILVYMRIHAYLCIYVYKFLLYKQNCCVFVCMYIKYTYYICICVYTHTHTYSREDI
jgi:hypothetical protein